MLACHSLVIAIEGWVQHSVIDRLMQHLQTTGMVDERPRSGPAKLHLEDRLIARCARRNRFATPARIRDELNFGDHVSVRSVD